MDEHVSALEIAVVCYHYTSWFGRCSRGARFRVKGIDKLSCLLDENSSFAILFELKRYLTNSRIHALSILGPRTCRERRGGVQRPVPVAVSC